MYFDGDGRGFLFKERLRPGEIIIWLMWLLVCSIYFVGFGLLFHPAYNETGMNLLILWILFPNIMWLIHSSSRVVDLIEIIHTPIIPITILLSMVLAGSFLLMLSADLGFTLANIIILWLTISGIVGAIQCRRDYQQYLNY